MQPTNKTKRRKMVKIPYGMTFVIAFIIGMAAAGDILWTLFWGTIYIVAMLLTAEGL